MDIHKDKWIFEEKISDTQRIGLMVLINSSDLYISEMGQENYIYRYKTGMVLAKGVLLPEENRILGCLPEHIPDIGKFKSITYAELVKQLKETIELIY